MVTGDAATLTTEGRPSLRVEAAEPGGRPAEFNREVYALGRVAHGSAIDMT
jgi:hypothetical protein